MRIAGRSVDVSPDDPRKHDRIRAKITAMPIAKEWGLTVDRVRNLLSYDPKTGKMFWRPKARDRSGRFHCGAKRLADRQAGYIGGHGYRLIGVDGHLCRAHRLAWLHYYGEWPKEQLDHINGDRSDDRISNLREASHSENQRNCKLAKSNTSGVKGVGWEKRAGRWQAYIRIDGRQQNLGLYDVFDDAVKARLAAERQFFGAFRRN